MDATNIAWSLETSGQSAVLHDITATGFFRPATESKRQQIGLYINPPEGAGEIDEQLLSRTLRDRTGYSELAVTLCGTERELLSGINRFTNSMEFRTERLVTYNGEDWTGGFALPFVRTRCAKCGLDWVFDDVPHLDLAGPLETHFNLETVDLESLDADALDELANHLGLSLDYRQQSGNGTAVRERIRDSDPTDSELAEWAQDTQCTAMTTSQVSLRDAHDLLCDGEIAFDPSQEQTTEPVATDADPKTAVRDIALHTLADLGRVRDLSEVIEAYVGQRYLDEIRL